MTHSFWVSLLLHPPRVPWEIIWIDDCSTDGTREWLAELGSGSCELGAGSVELGASDASVSNDSAASIYPCTNPPVKIRAIFNEKNLGYAANNNLGARAATGEVLVLLNNDLVLTKGCWGPLYDKLLSGPSIGVVGNVQVQPQTELIDHAGVFFDLAGCPGHRLKNRPIRSLNVDGVFSEAVTAACWLVRREVFLSVGGFDEQYRNGAEDFDLCLRLGQMGFRHWVDYRSVIYHHVSSSPGRKKHDLVNQARFLQKWAHLTSIYGQADWPKEYLRRMIRTPSQFNLIKFIDALLRVLNLRIGDSAWAVKTRENLIAQGQSEVKKLAS